MVLHVAGMAITAWSINIPIHRVQFGMGPSLGSFRIGTTRIHIALLPVAGYVKLVDKDSDNPHRGYVIDPHRPVQRFDQRTPATRAIIIIGGLAALMLPAFLVLGKEAISALILSWTQWVSVFGIGQLNPQDLISEAHELATGEPWLMFAAVTFAKVAGLNLLPFAILNGGACLLLAYEAVFGPPPSEGRAMQTYLWLSLLVIAASLILWLYNLADWLKL